MDEFFFWGLFQADDTTDEFIRRIFQQLVTKYHMRFFFSFINATYEIECL